jgi:FtsZ-binding cell division protein ZapB
MWFIFPVGATSITVEQQPFKVEIEDVEGRGYFRAPDHFAPQILAIAGFGRASPPEGAPEDLPPSVGGQNEPVKVLVGEIEGLKLEVQRLTEDANSVKAANAALRTENAELTRKLDIAENRVKDLEDELDDTGHKVPELATAGAPAKAK